MTAVTGEPRVLRVLIADDEPLVRRGLRAFLADAPGVAVVGEARDGDGAVAQARALAPDLVFLDVQMPERDGFGVLDALEPHERPAVVFVTAFDGYAARAFDVHAVDYLVKPFDEARFRTALERARARIRADDGPRAGPRPGALDDPALEVLLRTLRAHAGGEPGGALERLLVRERDRTGDRTVVVAVGDVDWFEAEDNYVRLHVPPHARAALPLRGTPLVRGTLTALAAALDPRRFARVHRSAVVRLGAVRALEPTDGGEVAVVLRDGTRLPLGRAYRAAFEARLQGLAPR